MDTTTTTQRSISAIAREIARDWHNVNYAAVPYLNAMRSIGDITERYYEDSAKSIVLYFLSNAQTWRGPVAKRIKAELNTLCKVA